MILNRILSVNLDKEVSKLKKLLVVFANTLTMAAFLCAKPASAQIIPPAKRAARVQITEGPALESTHDTQAIIRWTSNNPRGSDEHFAVLHYGTDPNNLSLIAKSHIRLNQQHSYTVFRVRALDLKPHTTYYYKVDSEDAKGNSDGVTSPVKSFTTQ
jgi:phosphodiesterase/alkaline phosphatase D-like protein